MAAPIDPGRLRQLERRRSELASRVVALQWDLGGLAYEMAIRDHFRLDTLLRRAAELQDCDLELAELERLLGGSPASSPGDGRSARGQVDARVEAS